MIKSIGRSFRGPQFESQHPGYQFTTPVTGYTGHRHTCKQTPHTHMIKEVNLKNLRYNSETRWRNGLVSKNKAWGPPRT